jgi:hypothetical protein
MLKSARRAKVLPVISPTPDGAAIFERSVWWLDRLVPLAQAVWTPPEARRVGRRRGPADRAQVPRKAPFRCYTGWSPLRRPIESDHSGHTESLLEEPCESRCALGASPVRGLFDALSRVQRGGEASRSLKTKQHVRFEAGTCLWAGHPCLGTRPSSKDRRRARISGPEGDLRTSSRPASLCTGSGISVTTFR